ncbi:MAG: hypothetical protein PHW60_10695 [Kiritimatiellae bacterium]|nr:hypothetical protein [Kiritimatiellia bacterium]
MNTNYFAILEGVPIMPWAGIWTTTPLVSVVFSRHIGQKRYSFG